MMHVVEFGYLLNFINIKIHLVNALVERWRTETHIFHLLHREIKVTLEDVTLQLGFSINREPMIGLTSGNFV